MKIPAYYMFDTAKDAPFQILLENPDDSADLLVAAGCFIWGSDALEKAWPGYRPLLEPAKFEVPCDYCGLQLPQCAIEDGASYSKPTPFHWSCIPLAFRGVGVLVSTELVDFKEDR